MSGTLLKVHMNIKKCLYHLYVPTFSRAFNTSITGLLVASDLILHAHCRNYLLKKLVQIYENNNVLVFLNNNVLVYLSLFKFLGFFLETTKVQRYIFLHLGHDNMCDTIACMREINHYK